MPGFWSCSPCMESLVSSTEVELSPRFVLTWGLQGLQPLTDPCRTAQPHRGLLRAECHMFCTARQGPPLPAPPLRDSSLGGMLVWLPHRPSV